MFRMCASNSHSYTHLTLALGIVRKPTLWVFITSKYPGTHDIGRATRGTASGRTDDGAHARQRGGIPTRCVHVPRLFIDALVLNPERRGCCRWFSKYVVGFPTEDTRFGTICRYLHVVCQCHVGSVSRLYILWSEYRSRLNFSPSGVVVTGPPPLTAFLTFISRQR